MRWLAIAPLCLLGCSFNANGEGSPTSTTSEGSSGTTVAGSSADTSSSSAGTNAGATSTDGTATVGSSSTTADGTTGAPFVCGESPPPLADECPPGCDECEDGVCIKNCMTVAACLGGVECPPDAPCFVKCFGPQVCQGLTITCPLEHACEVECRGVQACQAAEIVCGDGTCDLACYINPDACDEVQFGCGINKGTVTCGEAQTNPPVITQARGSTCSCAAANDCQA